MDTPDTLSTAEKRPEPVLNPVKLGGLVGAAVTATGGAVVLLLNGVTAENVSAVGIAVGGAVTAIAALAVYGASLFAGKAAREQVTPLSSPRSAEGEKLVPVSELPGIVQDFDGVQHEGVLPTSLAVDDGEHRFPEGR